MFCKNCGTQFPDGQAFCPECGTAVQSVAPVEEVQQAVNNTVNEATNAANEAAGAYNETAGAVQNAYSSANGDYSYNIPERTPMSAEAKKKLIKFIGIGAGAVLAFIILFIIFHGSPKKTVKKYFSAFEKGNTKKMVMCLMPKKSAETYIDDNYNMEPKEYYEYIDAASKVLLKGLKSEKYKLKVDVEIKEVEKLGKLDKLKSDVRDSYGFRDLDDFKDDKSLAKMLDKQYDIDIDKVKAVAAVEAKVKLTIGKEKLDSDTGIFLTFKYKGKWYLLQGDMPHSMYNSIVSMIQSYDDKDVRKDLKDVIKDYQDELKDFTKAKSKAKSKSSDYDIDDLYDMADDYLDSKDLDW